MPGVEGDTVSRSIFVEHFYRKAALLADVVQREVVFAEF